MADRVRYDLLLYTAMQVLSEHEDSVPGQAVLDEVERRVDLNAAERKVQSSGREAWEVALRYETGDAATSGWLVKAPPGWRISDGGRQALATFSSPGRLRSEVMRRYRGIKKQREVAQASLATSMSTIASLLDGISAGSWTSYDDIAIAVERDAEEVSHLLAAESFENSYRVLNPDGSIPEPRFQHVNYRGTDLRRRLANEGVDFDQGGRADQSQRITGELLHEQAIGLIDDVVHEGTRAWLVRGAAVSGYNIVPGWLDEGYASIAASHLRQLERGPSIDNLRAAVEIDYAHLSYAQRQAKLAELNAFLNRMGPGDAVVTTSEGRVYAGRVEGGADWRPGESLTTIRRPVAWEPAGVDWSELSDTMQTRLKSASTVVDLTDSAEAVEALFVGVSAEPPTETVVTSLPDLSSETVERLLVGKSWLNDFVDLLSDRRQVILYGPPGTGKTYLALEVAAALTDPENVSLVQFHPAYSYEDFFEGYRPTAVDDSGKVRFALTPGPLRKIVDQAREDPSHAYILIIDEINRANLAKVFGELYFLLEYRTRTIDLMYASGDEGRDFSLPKNVYVIGTMNTADRSIALVDAAMRRRFAFLSLHPDDEHMAGVLRDWLARETLPSDPADILDELNRRIPDKDFKIGPSYLMRDDVATDDGLDRIWRTQILPLLEEFHYGDPSATVPKRYGLASLRAAIARDDEDTGLSQDDMAADAD